MGALEISLNQLLNLAFSSPDSKSSKGVVNFNILLIFLQEIIKKLDLETSLVVDLDPAQARQVQALQKYIGDGPGQAGNESRSHVKQDTQPAGQVAGQGTNQEQHQEPNLRQSRVLNQVLNQSQSQGQNRDLNQGRNSGQNQSQNQSAGKNPGQGQSQSLEQNSGQPDPYQNEGQNIEQNPGRTKGANQGPNRDQRQDRNQEQNQASNSEGNSVQNQSQNSGPNPGQNSGPNPEQNSGHNPGNIAVQNTGQNSGQNQGQSADEQIPGPNQGQNPIQGQAQSQVYNLGQNLEQNPGRNPVQNAGQNQFQNQTQNSGRNSGRNQVKNQEQNVGRNQFQNEGRNTEENLGQNVNPASQKDWEKSQNGQPGIPKSHPQQATSNQQGSTIGSTIPGTSRVGPGVPGNSKGNQTHTNVDAPSKNPEVIVKSERPKTAIIPGNKNAIVNPKTPKVTVNPESPKVNQENSKVSFAQNVPEPSASVKKVGRTIDNVYKERSKVNPKSEDSAHIQNEQDSTDTPSPATSRKEPTDKSSTGQTVENQRSTQRSKFIEPTVPDADGSTKTSAVHNNGPLVSTVDSKSSQFVSPSAPPTKRPKDGRDRIPGQSEVNDKSRSSVMLKTTNHRQDSDGKYEATLENPDAQTSATLTQRPDLTPENERSKIKGHEKISLNLIPGAPPPGPSFSDMDQLKKDWKNLVLLPKDLDDLRRRVLTQCKIPQVFDERDILERLHTLWEAVNTLKHNDEMMAVRMVKQDAILGEIPKPAILDKIKKVPLDAWERLATDKPKPKGRSILGSKVKGLGHLEDYDDDCEDDDGEYHDFTNKKFMTSVTDPAEYDLRLRLVESSMVKRSDLGHLLSEKADKFELDRLVSNTEIADSLEELTTRLNNLIIEVYSKNEKWATVTDRLEEELQVKVDKSEFRQQLQGRLKKVEGRVEIILAQLAEERKDPAGTRKKLKDYNCLSCDRHADISGLTNGSQVPRFGATPCRNNTTTAAQRAFDLHQMRREKQRAQGAGSSLAGRRNMNLVSKELATGGCGDCSDQDMTLAPLLGSSTMDEGVNRYVGGSHTSVSPASRVAALHRKTEVVNSPKNTVSDINLRGKSQSRPQITTTSAAHYQSQSGSKTQSKRMTFDP